MKKIRITLCMALGSLTATAMEKNLSEKLAQLDEFICNAVPKEIIDIDAFISENTIIGEKSLHYINQIPIINLHNNELCVKAINEILKHIPSAKEHSTLEHLESAITNEIQKNDQEIKNLERRMSTQNSVINTLNYQNQKKLLLKISLKPILS